MISIERSIKILKTAKLHQSNILPEYQMALNNAIDALERQIPKKPVMYHHTPVCPTCRRLVVVGCGCQNNTCHQAIDWS